MDYNFNYLTTDQLAQMFIEVVRAGFKGDKEFTDALREEIKRRKPNESNPNQSPS